MDTIHNHITEVIKDEIIIENNREALYNHLINKMNTTDLKIQEANPYTIKAKYFKISIQEGGRAKLKVDLYEIYTNRTKIAIEITVFQDTKRTQIHNYCICLAELMKCLYMADAEGLEKVQQNKLSIDQEYAYFVSKFISKIHHKRTAVTNEHHTYLHSQHHATISFPPSKQLISTIPSLPALSKDEFPILLYNNCDWDTFLLTTDYLYVNMRDYETRLYINIVIATSLIHSLSFESSNDSHHYISINSQRLFVFCPLTAIDDIATLNNCINAI